MEGLIGCARGEDYLQVCCAPGWHLPHHHQDVAIVRAEVRAWDRAANDPLVFTITEKAPTRAFSWLKATIKTLC